MFVIREVMHCKPGKVRPLLEKFKQMGPIMVKMGMKAPRIMTDVSGEPYWTLVSEMEVGSLEEFFDSMNDPRWADSGMEELMKGYHELVDNGRREIFRVEA